MADDLTHFDSDGRARMVDVGAKAETDRRAVAVGRVCMRRETGQRIADGAIGKGDVLATVSDPFGEEEHHIEATFGGIIVGRAVMPIVNEGDAVFHVGRVKSVAQSEDAMDDHTAQLTDDPMFYEDEII